jgi:vanillate O-demethylase monooxygenase subunit
VRGDPPARRARARAGAGARGRPPGNYNLEQPDEVIQAFERTIFGQDQRMVESQRPDRVPFDLAAGLHLTFDAVAVAYRRAMRAHGFG